MLTSFCQVRRLLMENPCPRVVGCCADRRRAVKRMLWRLLRPSWWVNEPWMFDIDASSTLTNAFERLDFDYRRAATYLL